MDHQEYSSDLILQYSIVGIILLIACGWIVWRIIKKKKKGINSCCGCSLADSCKKRRE